MHIKICNSIAEISRSEWNLLVDDNNPFIRHEFLAALEENECVGEAFGWLPRHIAVYEQDQLIGAMPLYEKYNSYGEFVFDNAWADAYQRNQLKYFPKLVSSVPYTPAAGQRLLSDSNHRAEVYPLLLRTAQQLASSINASSFHCLFPTSDEHQWLQSQSLLTRYDCQFHWHNREYACFEDFLATLSSQKRKNIRKERQRVFDTGVRIRRLSGHEASDNDWQDFTRFYQQTFAEKWGVATLNYGFFRQVAEQLPDQVLLVLADYEGQVIAGSLMYQSDNTLYGRYWGCSKTLKGLHFEACYYQGIEYCIEQNLQHFEPGAQGEHKIARGFVPTLTKSSHWLAEDYFKQSIERFVEYEQQSVMDYIENMNKHTPYKKN